MNLPNATEAFFAGEQSVQNRQLGQLQRASLLAQLAERERAQQQGVEDRQRNQAMLAEIQALPPEKRNRENVLPIMLKYGMVKEALPHMKEPEVPKAQPIGAGGLRMPDGTVVPPAARPDTSQKPPPTRQRYDGEKVIQEELQPDGTWKQIGSGPRFAPQKPDKPDAATVTEVVDPKNPTRMLRVDARTYRGGSIGDVGVIGVSGNAIKETPEQARAAKMRGIGAALQDAEDILTGVKRDDKGNITRGALPTQSGAGAAYDSVAGWFGSTPEGAAEAQRLKVVAGVLVSKVPRMEGPQSNLDVELYKQMAGDAGNDKLPIARRLAAIRQMKQLYAKYEHLQGEGGNQPAPAAASPQYQEGQTATGPGGKKIVFKGGQWVPMQ